MVPKGLIETTLHNDEPTVKDSLNREAYAKALAKVVDNCDTPMVIGLYGTWGVGKTSLMKQIEKNLDIERNRPIWFDPWMHQFDENPVLPLAHTILKSLGKTEREEGKKLLTIIASAIGSSLLKSTLGISADDIFKLGKMYEEERFQVRENRVRLREHFESLVQKAIGTGNKKKRLVFFIDDLDRCMPNESLRLLEALKLYLNINGCIYFLGVDRIALEQNIKLCYSNNELRHSEYLDKM
ncbi:KAP family NTPase [bacterium]|nr:KAP family NTPase [bacterium]